MPFNKKSVLALCGAGALLFSMSALANNPAPTDPGDSGGGSAYQRGPDPSVSFLEAEVSTASVPAGSPAWSAALAAAPFTIRQAQPALWVRSL